MHWGPPEAEGRFYCRLCNCQCSQPSEWMDHVNGRRHQANMLLDPSWLDPYGLVGPTTLTPEQHAMRMAATFHLQPVRDYYTHFKALLQKENQLEHDAYINRANTWERPKLESEGISLFDLLPQPEPNGRGLLFMKSSGGPLPYSRELYSTQSVWLSPNQMSQINDTNRQFTVRGEVAFICREHIELKGLPNPLPRSPDGLYRIDLANPEVPFERMMSALDTAFSSLATNSNSRTSGSGVLAPQTPLANLFFAEIKATVHQAREQAMAMYKLEKPKTPIVHQRAAGVSPKLPLERTNIDAGRNLGNALLRLNASQQSAVRKVVDELKQLTLIQGPPGTGKTTTAVAVICEWLLRYKGGILACAHSNQGCDNLLTALLSRGVKAIRVGKTEGTKSEYGLDALIKENPLEVRRLQLTRELDEIKRQMSFKKPTPPHLVTYHDDLVFQLANLQKSGSIVSSALESAEVVCTTCVGAGVGLLKGSSFPFVLVDEATQCPEPATLIPMFHGSVQVVLVGDQCQLPPTIKHDEVARAGLDVSLFDRILSLGFQSELLAVQYRMHPSISGFSSWKFYQGKIKDGVGAEDRPLPCPSVLKPFFPDPAIQACFVHVEGYEQQSNTSKANPEEAQCVAAIVHRLQSAGENLNNIGIITPYDAHVRLLTQQLRGEAIDELEVSSVDGFQGREKEIIILSTVRSNVMGDIGFVADWRRVNVAMTRARSALIIVGNVPTLVGDPLWKDIFRYYRNNIVQWDSNTFQVSTNLSDHVKNVLTKECSEPVPRPRNTRADISQVAPAVPPAKTAAKPFSLNLGIPKPKAVLENLRKDDDRGNSPRSSNKKSRSRSRRRSRSKKRSRSRKRSRSPKSKRR